ncbi:ankyrin repeat domain-containing protein 7-like isoform X1 [Euwallacea fornicatus]|uniref:ankyrin repeat domain-containing protein 7-like isoform X1 n=1 Tax=Euwallacea fornicatus TaxID=995702 RepID=UPI00338F2A33
MNNENEVQNEGSNTRKDGLNKLHKSCLEGRLDDVINLLAQGIDIKVVDTKNDSIYSGKTCLHFAAETNKTDIMKVLLEHDITIIDIQDNGGFTALHCAAFHGNVEAAKILLHYGANTELGNEKEWKPLHSAASARGKGGSESKENDFLKIVELLLHYGANLESKNHYDDTPLHIAFYFNNISIAAFLFGMGADLEATDVYGNTAISKLNKELEDAFNKFIEDGKLCEMREKQRPME